jgi:hypothetical protein
MKGEVSSRKAIAGIRSPRHHLRDERAKRGGRAVGALAVGGDRDPCLASVRVLAQLAAFLRSPAIFFSSAEVSSFSAK